MSIRVKSLVRIVECGPLRVALAVATSQRDWMPSMTAWSVCQRELILGDRQTGKTAIAIDSILHQRGQAASTQNGPADARA